MFITAGGASDISRRMINERLALAEDGVLVFSVVLSADGEEIVAGPELHEPRVPAAQGPSRAVRRARGRGARHHPAQPPARPEFSLQLRNNVQNVIQRVIFQRTKINPVVLGMVSYVEDAPTQEKRRQKQKQAAQ